MKSLLQITEAINENLSQEELLQRYQDLLTIDLGIGKFLFNKFEDSWRCILQSGDVHDAVQKINVETDLLCFSDITSITSSPIEALSGFDIIIPVIHKNKPIAFVIIGDIDEEGEGLSPTIKHLTFVQTLSNIIIVAIENIRLFKELLRQEALKKELELASKMQSMLIPNNSFLPNNEKMHISAFYFPHLEVGGDYYDYIELSKDEFGFCISDVSGKGMSAALLMSNFQANLRALFTHEISLAALIEELNKRVMHSTKGEKFITLFVARFNFKTRELEYINAGHNQPIMYQKKSKEMRFLTKGCVGLGMLDEIPMIRKGSITIEEPSKILCYTDGLIELLDGKGVTFGTQEIEQCILNESTIDENITDIIKKQGIQDGNTAIFDDISILGIELF
ncbi:MAG: SpoIIE family protein phosphatase [Bacteroidales bacterium]|nr:SpoIIE family protein phosphatase [Bacteroidales bacterium]